MGAWLWWVIPILIAVSFVALQFFVDSGGADKAAFEQSEYSSRMSFCKALNEKMRYCIHPQGMRYIKFSMNIFWPLVALGFVWGLIMQIKSGNVTAVSLIIQITMCIVSIMNCIALRGVDSISYWTNFVVISLMMLRLIFQIVMILTDANAIWILDISPSLCLIAWCISDLVYFHKRKKIFMTSVRKLKKAYFEKYPDELEDQLLM